MAIDKINFKIDDFSGGLNERDANHKIQNNESVQPTQNIALSRRGALSKREGMEKFIPTSAGGEVHSIFEGFIRKQALWSLWGDDRYHTCAQVMQLLFTESTTAVLASGDPDRGDYADAAAGDLLAAALEAPLFLIRPDRVPSVVKDTMKELGVEKVYLLGGPVAIQSDVVQNLEDAGYEVERVHAGSVDKDDVFQRIFGENRYDTCVKIMQEFFPTSKDVVIATGETGGDYADAAAGNLLAGVLKAPMLLVRRDSVPPGVISALQKMGVNRIYILGGELAITPEVEQELRFSSEVSTIRVAGANRVETAHKILEVAMPNISTAPDTVYIVGREGQADAVVAGPSIAGGNADNKMRPLLFVTDELGDSNITIMERYNITKAIIIGGTARVSNDVATELCDLLGEVNVSRIAGDTRYHTAIDFATYLKDSQNYDPLSVIIVNGSNDSIIDGVVAGKIGARIGAAIILASPDGVLHNFVDEFLNTNLGVDSTINLFGGPLYIDRSDVEYGSLFTRVETAVEILSVAATKGAISNTCYVVGFGAPADAAIAGPGIAGGVNNELRPLLYTRKTELGQTNEDALSTHSITNAVIVGGTAVVSEDVEDELKVLLGAANVSRIAGDTRYHTAIEFAQHLNFTSAIISLGTDRNLVDTVYAGLLGARLGGAIVLSTEEGLPSHVKDYLDDTLILGSKVFIFGGPDAIGMDAWTEIESLSIEPDPEFWYLAVAGNSLKRWDGANWITLTATLTPDAKMEFAQNRNAIYMVNGADGYFTIKEDLLTDEFTFQKVRPYTPSDEELESLGPNEIPSNPKYILLHKDRIWLISAEKERKRVYMSDIGTAGENSDNPFKMHRPDYFPVNNHLDIHCAKGDTITGQAYYQDRVFIFTRNSIWAISGDSPANYNLARAREDIGATSHRSIKDARGLLLFHSIKGPVAFNGSDYYELGWKVPDTLGLIDTEDYDKAQGVADSRYYYLTFPDFTLKLDLQADLYTPHNKVWTKGSITPSCLFIDRDGVLQFGGEDGFIRKLGEWTDDGVSIVSKYTTKQFGEGAAYRFKRFRVRLKQHAGILTFKHRVDMGEWVSDNINMGNGNEARHIYKDVYSNRIGETIQVQLEHSGAGNFEIESIEVQAYARKVRP